MVLNELQLKMCPVFNWSEENLILTFFCRSFCLQKERVVVLRVV
jgi:hypothetical protein